jgi:transcriptional repressor NrdR
MSENTPRPQDHGVFLYSLSLCNYPVIEPYPHFSFGFPLAFYIAVCQYIVMVCIYCTGKTEVVNSRPQKRANQIWRRRHCFDCGNIFTTIEGVNLSSSLLVQNPGSLEPFLRDKLLLSMYDCLRHRKNPVNDATALTATVLHKLLGSVASPTLTRAQIVNTVASVLKNFDHAAHVQYMAFHPL